MRESLIFSFESRIGDVVAYSQPRVLLFWLGMAYLV